MSTTAKKIQMIAPGPSPGDVVPGAKKQKVQVILVTADDALWPQVGADLPSQCVLKQLDSVDELLRVATPEEAAIILWDAREAADPAALMSSLGMHAPRAALVVLDEHARAPAWSIALQHRQIVALVGLPLWGASQGGSPPAGTIAFGAALDAARDEVNVRAALLGDAAAGAAPAAAGGRRRWVIAVASGLVLIAALASALLLRGRGHPAATRAAPTVAAAVPAPGTVAATPSPETAPPIAAADSDDTVDANIEKAQQAMLERHFIEPAAGSALTLYRDALIADPDNGEARQGLQRLAQILIARVQSALDEHKFDVALQSLEIARSIDADDGRLAALDERFASMRAELGPAQILAALSALNFDRASQLIDEASRAKSLSPAKLAQLRDDLHRRQEEFDVTRLTKLIDSRLQQDRLLEPRGDSAAFYLQQAKQAGAVETLQPQVQELSRRAAAEVHAAIDQRRFPEAERMLVQMRGIGLPAGVLPGLQRELAAARSLQPPKSDVSADQELAKARLAQEALQSQLLERARAALDAGDVDGAQGILASASNMGPAPQLDALKERLAQKIATGNGVPQVPEQSLTRLNKLDVQYPYSAMQKGVEGWVELAYNINPDGAVAAVKVLKANPTRMFEAAAVKAVSKLKYQPVVQGGKRVTVATELRVVFRIPN